MTLIVDSPYVINWWVDASFAMHNNFRGYTGGIMSPGAGSITSSSWKQNINRQISTEKKIIVVNDIMGPVLWTLYFVQAQGYTVEINIMFQDNHITMCMMLNGKKSSLKNTKQINIIYFFVNDVINRGEILVEYFPMRTFGQMY